MSLLPIIDQPYFNVTIPSTEKTTQYRPFTVKEEKILLIAQESKDISQVILSIKQVLGNCFPDISIDDISLFDMEYLLINLRARSVNDVIEINIKDPDTDEEVKVEIDIDNVTILRDENHDRIVNVSDEVQLYMDYPKIDMLEKMSTVDETKKNTLLFDIMMGCISQVIKGDEVFNMKEMPKEDVENFINSLRSEHVEKIKDFYSSIPKVRLEADYMGSDGVEKKFVAEGTETFFI